MHGMFKRTALVLGLAMLLSSCNMWTKPAKGWSGATGGEKIEQYFWDDVKGKDFRKVQQFLSSSLVVSGPAGAMDRDTFFKQLQAANIGSFTLSDCASRVNGGDLVISCTLQRDGSGGGRFATLSVWQQYTKGWLLVAHSETPIS